MSVICIGSSVRISVLSGRRSVPPDWLWCAVIVSGSILVQDAKLQATTSILAVKHTDKMATANFDDTRKSCNAMTLIIAIGRQRIAERISHRYRSQE